MSEIFPSVKIQFKISYACDVSRVIIGRAVDFTSLDLHAYLNIIKRNQYDQGNYIV